MKVTVNEKLAQVTIKHMTPEEFKTEYPTVVPSTCLSEGVSPNRMTVAEVIYDNCSSLGLSICHENDSFKRRKGSTSALSRALKQHPSFKGSARKELRRELFTKMFRSEPSPYSQLNEVVRGRPELARKLLNSANEILSGVKNAD